MKVTERPTGNMTFGAGYSTTDKLLLQVALNKPNFLGTGNTFGVEVNTGQTQRTASVSYVDPYFTNDGVSLGADLYSRTFNASNSGLGDYRIRSSGAGLRLGIPYTELDRLSFGLVFEQNQIKPGTTGLPQRYIDYVTSSAPPAMRGCSPSAGRVTRVTAATCPRAADCSASISTSTLPGRICPTTGPPTSMPGTSPSRRTTPGCCPLTSAMAAASPASPIRCSRTSTPAASARCGASAPTAWARAT